MKLTACMRLAPLFLAAGLAAQDATAATQVVALNVLNASATLPAPLLPGDSLRLNTLVTAQTGALLQTITFSLGAGVASLGGQAAWEVGTATGTGPRLTGVNIDIFNNTTNALLTSDTFSGTLAAFALSTFASSVGPGTYRMVATGTGVRDASLDVTLSFASAVPEPASIALLLAGLAAVALRTRRRG